ncbi:MAG: AMP-binding protein [Planctomycetota bacterium]|jgi:long-chain acyl-CoA synthetase
MIDLKRHSCLQGALEEAFLAFSDDPCLIEADRDRERCRLTYREVRAAALPLASYLQDKGCRRAAILMTNQSKWHISACAVFRIGATLVPLDPKLSPDEHRALLEHCEADTLIIEHHLWRDRDFDGEVLVTEAPPGFDLRHAARWEECRGEGARDVVERSRADHACIVYSSGTGGTPKGCVLTHGNYLWQCQALLEQYRFDKGDRYLSILPTNHAIDFMVGFIGPYACGARVVHLRTLRPELVKEAFPRYGIAYMALVPMILKNLEDGLRQRLAGKTLAKGLIRLNRLLTRRRPNLALSRLLLRPVHQGFGGKLKALFVGGAFTDPATLRFFYGLGIQVANGYGLTEAGTVITLNAMDDYRPDTVGRPLPGTEVRIVDAGPDGIGEVTTSGPTVMAHYLKEPELTARTIRDGWLFTGDLGRLEPSGHLVLVGRKKNMIVTAGGKNVYPEDIENAFLGLAVKEFCIFAEHYLWSERSERLVIAVRSDDRDFAAELRRRNRRLPDFKRVHGYLLWDRDFPRTASLKVKRELLADEIRQVDPAAVESL